MRNKFISAVLTGSLLLLSAATMQGQPYWKVPEGNFSSVAIGVNAGTDGIGITTATAFGGRFELRPTITIIPKSTGLTFYSTFDYSGPWGVSGRHDCRTSLEAVRLETFLDWFPWPKDGFRITVGFAASEGRNYLTRTSEVLPAKTPDGYYEVAAGKVMLDPDCRLRFGMDLPDFLPYVGIGGGHCLSDTRKSQFGIDFGIFYKGRTGIYGYDYSSGDPEKVPIEPDEVMHIEDEVRDLTYKALGVGVMTLFSKSPVLPVLRVTYTYRIL